MALWNNIRTWLLWPTLLLGLVNVLLWCVPFDDGCPEGLRWLCIFVDVLLMPVAAGALLPVPRLNWLSALCMSIPTVFILARCSFSHIGEAILFFVPVYALYVHLVSLGIQARMAYSEENGRLPRRIILTLGFATANAGLFWLLAPSVSYAFLFLLLLPIVAGGVIFDPQLRWFIALSMTVSSLGSSGRDIFGAGLAIFAIYYLLVEFGTATGQYVRERKRCNLAELSR